VVLLPHAFGDVDSASRADEFVELVRSAGAEVLTRIEARIGKPNPKFYIGSGKADELAEAVRAHDADLVLVDHTLTPVQERNLERHLQTRVIDRAGLILDIFAQRARSHEGKLEVELAQLKHVATRLVRGWTHLDTQRGGAIGNRGPGETQLETDRRLLAVRVKMLSKRLDKVQTQRDQQRRARVRNTVPRVALVGYTNAGKSTLLNRLTHAGVLVDNQLFATLDTTVRRSETVDGREFTLADTVGFVRELPPQLVEAFRSTLEEVGEADLLLHVVDGSHPDPEGQISAVRSVLADVEATDVKEVIVINKADAADPEVIDRILLHEKHSLAVSARTGRGIPELLELIAEELPKPDIDVEVLVPYARGDLVSRLHDEAEILSEDHAADGTRLRARVNPDLASELTPFAAAG
jgi:GTP-binding protein HflX